MQIDHQPRIIHVADNVEKLMHHDLYGKVLDASSLRIFMKTHVFCVWDFQSLLKALQRKITCVTIPWLPTSDPLARRLINEIVLDEESDEIPQLGYLSHFELYLAAMDQCGADSRPIIQLTKLLRAGMPFDRAIGETTLPNGVAEFITTTLKIAQSDSLHRIAAAFTYGREDIIPTMFQNIVNSLSSSQAGKWDLFQLYLNRHIEHDGERHGPLSRALVDRICGSDDRLWKEAEETVRECLAARIALWSCIEDELESEKRSRTA
jgi:hypothetical protein